MLGIVKTMNPVIGVICVATLLVVASIPSTLAENDSDYTNRQTRDSTNLSYSNTKNRKVDPRTGEVYLIRGLANIFSLGMDEIEEKMEARGLNARTFNHSGWRSVADDIVRRSKKNNVSYPIVIAGHSLGANSSVSMANYLADNGLEVALVVAYDPTINRAVGKNIDEVVNFYVPNATDSNAITKGPGFKGRLKNVDISDMKNVGHMNLEKEPELQDELVNRVMKITRAKK